MGEDIPVEVLNVSKLMKQLVEEINKIKDSHERETTIRTFITVFSKMVSESANEAIGRLEICKFALSCMFGDEFLKKLVKR